MKRLDVLLYARHFTSSQDTARQLIEGGAVFVENKVVRKPSERFPDEVDIRIVENIINYVSRGGVKLEAALDSFMVDVRGKVCADIGASTGGFTDCLLQRGAERVYAIDNGAGQLHPKIRADLRVRVIENMNARYLHFTHIGEMCDYVVLDVSFVSQKLMYRNVVSILADGGEFITLVKPQFETGRDSLAKTGVVRESRLHMRVIEELIAEGAYHGLTAMGLIFSPITSGDGNIEYLLHFTKQPIESTVNKNLVEGVVGEAFNSLG